MNCSPPSSIVVWKSCPRSRKRILRLGAFELKERLDVPYRVVINEGIELAKVFGADDSFKYVNGVLDKLARKLRYQEASERPFRD